MNEMKIALIGAKSPFRTRVCSLLWGSPFRVVVKSDDMYDALRQIGRATDIGLALIESPRPGRGYGAVVALRQLLGNVPIAAVAWEPTRSQLTALLTAGVDSVLTADMSRAEFHDCLRITLLGEKALPRWAVEFLPYDNAPSEHLDTR